MKLDEFYDPNKPAAFKFDNPGDTIGGTIAQEPALVDDKFNEGQKVLRVDVETDDGEQFSVYARGQMKDAIGAAVVTVDAEAIEQGGHLTITYGEDKTLRSGRTMKVYSAVYVPPEPMGTAELGETDPWGGA